MPRARCGRFCYRKILRSRRKGKKKRKEVPESVSGRLATPCSLVESQSLTDVEIDYSHDSCAAPHPPAHPPSTPPLLPRERGQNERESEFPDPIFYSLAKAAIDHRAMRFTLHSQRIASAQERAGRPGQPALLRASIRHPQSRLSKPGQLLLQTVASARLILCNPSRNIPVCTPIPTRK